MRKGPTERRRGLNRKGRSVAGARPGMGARKQSGGKTDARRAGSRHGRSSQGGANGDIEPQANQAQVPHEDLEGL
eukprot:8767827-Heterocapsa_arctica.AAC.1